jgi:hypothetical protein
MLGKVKGRKKKDFFWELEKILRWVISNNLKDLVCG